MLTFDRPPVPKLIDFGLAQTKASSASRSTKVEAAGTLAYMAPELLGPRSEGNHKVDQYAAAVTINEIFGKRPLLPSETLFMSARCALRTILPRV